MATVTTLLAYFVDLLPRVVDNMTPIVSDTTARVLS